MKTPKNDNRPKGYSRGLERLSWSMDQATRDQ